jgi:uncharacterized protein YutE (UPF0331/DUF86 family)
MQTANSTIVDITSMTNSHLHPGNPVTAPGTSGGGTANQTKILKAGAMDEMPKLKEIWRWIKNLLQCYISLKKNPLKREESERSHYLAAETSMKIVNILQSILLINNVDDLVPAIESLAQYRDDAERVISMIKMRYRLPKKYTVSEVEMHLGQQARSGVTRNGMQPVYSGGGVGYAGKAI